MTKDDTFGIDLQSPYYLHPSDGTGAIITSIKFDGKNYATLEQGCYNGINNQK